MDNKKVAKSFFKYIFFKKNVAFCEARKKSLNKCLGGQRKNKSINRYLGVSPNILPLEEMGQKSQMLWVFAKRNCTRLSAGRLPHQFTSDFDDFCAV